MLLVLITLTCENLRALREVTRGASPIWLVSLLRVVIIARHVFRTAPVYAPLFARVRCEQHCQSAWCQYYTPRASHVMPKIGKILEAVEDTFGSKQG